SRSDPMIDNPTNANVAIDVFVMRIPDADRLVRRADAAPADRDFWTREKKWSDIKNQFVNEPLIKCFAEHGRAAFDEHACYFALSKFAQHGAQSFFCKHERAVFKRIGEK